MKKYLVVVILCLAAVFVQAGSLTPGVHELRLEVVSDLEGHEDTRGPIGLIGLGYCVRENVLVGGQVSFQKSRYESYWGKDDVWGLGVFAEYELPTDTAMKPFAGLSLGVLDGDADDDTVLVVTASAGAKLFLSDTIALSLHVNYHWANDDVYDWEFAERGGKGKNSDFSIAGGIRVILP